MKKPLDMSCLLVELPGKGRCVHEVMHATSWVTVYFQMMARDIQLDVKFDTESGMQHK